MKILSKNYTGGLILATFTAVTLLIWHGCSESPGSVSVGDEDNSSELPMISCTGLELGASSSEPVAKIPLSGLTAGFGDDPLARIYNEGNTEDYDIALINRLDGEEAELVVPVHPGSWREGGSVDVVIVSEDEQTACEAISLHIEALEPSPVELETELLSTEVVFNSFAESIGFDLDQLLSVNIEDVNLRYRGLAALVQAFNGENHPNSIRALLDGTAPVLAELQGGNEGDDGGELLDAILNKAGFFEIMEEIRKEFEERAKVLQEKRSKENAGTIYSKDKSIVLHKSESDITSVLPAELDALMEDHAWFVEMNSGYSGELREILELSFGSLSITLGAIGALPLAAKLGAAGSATTAVGLYWSYSESILPSIMQDIEIEADPVIYNENQDDVGRWSATLEVHSSGWTLTWPTVVSLVPLLGPAGRMIGDSVSIPGISPLSKTMLETFHGYFTMIWGMSEDSGPYTIPAIVYEIREGISPERPRESEFFRWDLRREFGELEDNPFRFGESDSQYHPVAVGRSSLRVRTNFDRFNEQFRESSVELEVKAIEVEIKPGPGAGEGLENGPPFYVQAGTGEVIPFVAEVSNAEEYEISWNLTGEGSLVRTVDDEADYIAPNTERLDLLVAAVEATGGARDNPDAPRRSTSARIYSVESQLIVTPGINCLELDTEQAFSAVLDGDPIGFDKLEWTITGPGSLSNDGVYISGSEGEVTIEFRLRDDDSTIYEISFEVREFCTTPDLAVSPVPVCLEPDEQHQFNFLVNGEPVSFDQADWIVSGPGSMSSDGIFTPTGTGDVGIEIWLKERPDVTIKISFQVEEVCSYMTITFTRAMEDNAEFFPYEASSSCVSLEPFDSSNTGLENAFGDTSWKISVSENDPFILSVWIHEDLVLTEESGWTKTLWPNLWQVSMLESGEYNMFFLSNPNYDRNDPDNYGWLSFDGGFGSVIPNSYPFEISRETRLINNDIVQAFSGSFEGIVYTSPLWVYRPQVFRVEFKNIMPEDFGCI
ncbi:MAG: hypothetical protein EA391_10590 [Balneolaceae bacterium]|nr:MAG: hypothetical protein EA391_10590 [Balneolaceae bacterium]